MLKELQEALQPREEQITLGGKVLIVREVEEASIIGGIGKGDPDAFYHLMVACVYVGEEQPRADGDDKPTYKAGELALSADDIPAIKRSGRRALRPLAEAVARVNGLNVEAEVKNSEGAQG